MPRTDVIDISSNETSLERIFKKKAKNDQSRARNGKDKVKPKPKSVKVRKSTLTKSKVNQLKKIQLEGLKLSQTSVSIYKSQRQGFEISKPGKVLQ
ncbi:hypothetical protein Tco_0184977 [Tanacetum coccineum]